RDAILAPWGPRSFRGPHGTSRPGRVPDTLLTVPGVVAEYGKPATNQDPRPGCCASAKLGDPCHRASRSRGGPARSQVVFPVARAVVPEVLAVFGLHRGDVLGRGPLDLVDLRVVGPRAQHDPAAQPA